MQPTYSVVIISKGKTGKYNKYETIVDNIFSVTRVINTYRLKRGYEIVRIEVEKGLI